MKSLIFLITSLVLIQTVSATEIIHVIAVNGVAEKAVDPNLAIFQVEVWGRGATAKAAQAIQVKFYEKVKEAIGKFNIKKEDFKTENFSINPEYVYEPKTQKNKITGYKVSHQIMITYRKVDNAGSLVDALSDSKDDVGGVNIQGISWDYDKKSVIESVTLAEAVQAARAKAEELAKAAGVKIKGVHHIQQESSSPVIRANAELMSASLRMDKSAAAPTELSSGQVKIRVDVQMEFEI